jgi:hypothetical protein
MATFNRAESDALTDFGIVFLGGLGLSAGVGVVDPHLGPYSVCASLVSAAVAALNTYRKDSGLPAVSGGQ